MHFKYVAITFATYAISNVFAAPAASPDSDVTGLRVRAEPSYQAQEDANTQLDTNGNKGDQHNGDVTKQQEAKPAYVQNNVEHPQKQQEDTPPPEDQKNTDVKPTTEHKNNNEAAPAEYQQSPVDTTKDQKNSQGSKDQMNDEQMKAVDIKEQGKGQDTKDQLNDQQMEAVDTKDTKKPQDTQMTEDTQYDDQQNTASPSYNQDQWQGQGKGQGKGQTHRTDTGWQVENNGQGGKSWHRQQTYSYRGGSWTGRSGAWTVDTCEFHGEFLCNGFELFGICSWGNVIWQPVAAGTACVNGGIGWAKKLRV